MRMPDEDLDALFEFSPWFSNTAEDITPEARIETQSILQKYTTHSISATINLASDTPKEVIDTLYKLAWKNNLKGTTVYRDGCRAGILTKTAEEHPVVTERPLELECKVVQFKNEKKEWIAFVGILNGTPHEIFTGPKDLDTFPIPSSVTEGTIIKVKVGDYPSRYDFRYVDSYGYTNTLGGLSRIFDKEYWNYARLLSALLRESVLPEKMIKIIEGLNFSNKSMTNWKSGVMRAFKPFIIDGTKSHGEICSDCGQESIVYQNGCKQCLNCGNSKCS
jgi:ribonucleoside-diphosphate reductase alpha chain